MNIRNKINSAAAGFVARMVRRSAAYQETAIELRAAQGRAARLHAENIVLAERTVAIAKRLCSVTTQSRPEMFGRRLRVCIEIDPEILERGFLHGDDALMIDYIGRHIGVEAAYQIRRANFQRWEI